MSCGWEGNRRSGVALAMRHRLQWFIHLRTQGLTRTDEPTLLMGYDTVFNFTSHTANATQDVFIAHELEFANWSCEHMLTNRPVHSAQTD